MDQPLLAPTFLFRFATPCLHHAAPWTAQGARLEAAYGLPSFGELESRPLFADVRAAWNADGLTFTVEVANKKQPIWCRESRVEDSDGLRVWIDTRDTHNIHRATRFCHQFLFLPQGGGARGSEPVATLVPINRARENPKPVDPRTLRVRSDRRYDGYRLEALIPAEALTGFEPIEHPRLGFMYAVVDREHGWQTYSIGSEFPIDEDPSLWNTLELVNARPAKDTGADTPAAGGVTRKSKSRAASES